MTILTKQEKTDIISAHIKSLKYNEYNLQMDLLQENAKTVPNTQTVTSVESQIQETGKQITALNAELTAVAALTE